MQHRLRHFGVWAAAISALLFTAALSAAESAEGLQQRLSGAELYGTNPFGNPYTFTLEADGTMRGVAGYNSEFTDKGRWWVRDDGQVCRQWNTWLSGEARCAHARLEDGLIVWVTPDGQTMDAVYYRPAGGSAQSN